MNIVSSIALGIALTTLAIQSPAQTSTQDDDEELKIAAIEALMSAPPQRALPIVRRVLQGEHSDDVKERALFVLSQAGTSEAQTLLLEIARDGDGDLQYEAIRMIGISGDDVALASLRDIYSTGDREAKESVLEAFMIAHDSTSVYEIALAAQDGEEFEEAVEMLGAMGALDELRKLRESSGNSAALIEAYAIAGDSESLRAMALDNSNPELQEEAIEALGIVGGSDVNATLLQIYREAGSAGIREAALDGMLISGYDEGVLLLFRESNNSEEKRELLEMLVMMDSDAALQVIDETLGEQP